VFRSASLALLALVACSGSTEGTGEPTRQALDVPAFCAKLIDECKDTSVTKADCESTFTSLRVSPECANGFSSAACVDVSKRGGLCFPSCTANAQACNGDGTITTCTTDGRSITLDCAGVCTSSNKKFTGTCADSYGTQKSVDGRPRCWCE